MDASIWKLKALIKKNFLEMKRNLFSTFCEIFFPIILMLLILLLKSAFKVETKTFDLEEKNNFNFMEKHSIVNVNFSSDDYNTIETWNGMNYSEIFKICSNQNENNKERPLIAMINVPDDIKNTLKNDSEKYGIYQLDDSHFKNFSSLNEMDNYIKDISYGEDENHPLICFGISYSENGNNYDYTLHYFEKELYNGAEDIPPSQHILDPFQSGPDMDAYEKYQKNGYTYIMKVISEYIIKKETNNNVEINFGILPMKYLDYREDLFASVIGFLGPFFIIIAYMAHLCIYVYRMVSEKESKAKEGMKVMGLTDGIYFCSYFIQYTAISIFDSIINAFIFIKIFNKIPYIIFFFIFFLFSLNVFALAYFFQSFINKAKESLIISMLLYFIMFFISLLVTNETATYNMKVGLSFFPPVTIYIGIILLGKFESQFRTFKYSDIFEMYTNYSIIVMFVMLIADIIIYLFLGYYFQNVIPQSYGIRKPWYFIFKKIFKILCFKKKVHSYNINYVDRRATINNSLNNNNNNNALNDNFQSEEIYKDMVNPKDCLRIINLVKQFDDGKKAVNRVNLNLYKNEIFALLGHNGAGKTTLISILTGMYEATGGEAIYDDLNILSPENVDTFRKKVGICPQHDVLFGDLSIREHLELFAIFKGVHTNELNNEINKSITDFQFDREKTNIPVKNLSAGDRRKLSIAISLIGGSEIIFLDEPSSGMDITSRRNLWEILKRQSNNKIIILTTHYMEEASVLGKRIGIINLGKMKCIGTPLFLIEKFGKFMSINISKDEGANDKDIISFINENVESPEFESLSEEILVRIPKDNFLKDKGKISLHDFFENLDENLNKLKIKTYSVSMPTLEDVFLNIAAEDETDRLSKIIETEKKNDEILFNSDYLDNFENKSKFMSDFKTNCKRRLFLMIRDKKGFLLEILCPILLVLIGGIISQVKFVFASPDFSVRDISSIGNQVIYFSGVNVSDYLISRQINITSKILNLYDDENHYLCEVEDNEQNEIYNQNYNDENENYTLNISDYIECIYDKTIYSESNSQKEVDMNSKNYIGYYGSLLLLNENNNNENKYEFVELINARVTQGVPIYTAAFLEKIVQNEVKKKSSKEIFVNFKNKVMVRTKKQELSSNSQNGTVIIFVAIAFALIPANFISIIVRERYNNSKHLMRLSGLNIFSYWIVNFMFEIIKYYFTGGICLIILKIFDYYSPYLILFYLLYGPPLILFTYFISFFFDDESSALNKMVLLHSLIGVLGSSTIIVLRGNESVYKIGKFLQYVFSILPSFLFNFGYSLSFNKIFIYMVDYPDEWMKFTDKDLIKRFNLLKGPLIFLGIETIIYLGLLFFMEFLTYSSFFKKTTNNILFEESEIKDEGVLNEIHKASKTEIISNDNSLINKSNDLILNDTNEKLMNPKIKEEYEKTQFIVIIKNLKKIYNTGIYKIFFCCFKEKGKVAIKNLNFCLEKGECFGLLGLNGAGKTSTFKCITQEISPSNGVILINGINSQNNFNLIKNKFGYCPQYDAIFEYMTVYENLEFYAKIKGVKQEFINQIVEIVIKEMRLDEFTKKISGRLSGGNKRKLSVAIAMLCNPPIILLDEPSTGMDPEARRFMWSVIHKMSKKGKKSSVIMTTHSMDEAETLCKRMAIMVNGEFVCLGKANEIKNKYGYGYELNLRIKPMTEEQENELYFSKYNIDSKIIVKKDDIQNILNQIDKENFINEFRKGRLGEKLLNDIEKSNGVSIRHIINFIFYVQNAIKFVTFGIENFNKIIIEENMDNNFLFKMKKKENENKSIGYLFGLYDIHKEECFVTEYSIQQTSLEQIFNSFSQKQDSEMLRRNSTIVEEGDVENIKSGSVKSGKSKKIILTKNYAKELLGEDY